MESNQELVPDIRGWNVQITIVEPSQPLSKFVQNHDAKFESEEELKFMLESDVFSNIDSYFHSFSFFPPDGTFMANEHNVPIMLISRYIDGVEQEIVFICAINEEPTKDKRMYAFRHPN